MKKIPKVIIIDSNIEHNGEIKRCVSAIVDPYPQNIVELGDTIRAAIQGMHRRYK